LDPKLKRRMRFQSQRVKGFEAKEYKESLES